MEIRATVTSRSGTLTLQKIHTSAQRRLSTETHVKAPHELNYASDAGVSLVILDPNAIRERR